MTPLALLLLTALLPCVSEPFPTATPAAAGMDPATLQDAVTLYDDAVRDGRIEGAVLLVARGGKIVLHKALGMRDRERGLRYEPDTLFRMASNTKPVIAAAVLSLVEEGKVGLQDPISKYLPAFATDGAGDAAKITVHQLLTHTSGLRISSLFLMPLLKETSLQREVDRFAAVGPKVQPGTSYAYSNPGFNTLGALIEVVAGAPLETVLQERFYTPLGMDDTSNSEVADRVARMATVYRHRDGAATRGWSPGDPPDFPFVRASGGMISTAPDYLRFLQMYLDLGTSGGRRLLRRASVELATTAHTRSTYTAEEAAKRRAFYGYGWSVMTDGSYAHGGSDGTFAWVDPTHELVGIVFTQSPGAAVGRDKFVELVTASCTGDAPARETSARNAGFLDPDLDFESWLARFEGESREIAKYRDALTDAIELSAGEVVADIGAGTGLFTGPMRLAVGETGAVHPVDISPVFIDHLTQRSTDRGWSNVHPVLCSERSTGLAPGTIDAAFICDTYHHFSYPADTLKSLFAAMKPGGRLVVVDFIRDPMTSRPWVLEHARAGKEVFRAEIEGAGFAFVDQVWIEGLTENYVIRFRRP